MPYFCAVLQKNPLLPIRSAFQAHTDFSEWLANISASESRFEAQNLLGAGQSFAVSHICKQYPKSVIWVVEDKETAAYRWNEFQSIHGTENNFFFPKSYKQAYEVEETQNANVVLRLELLNKIQSNAAPKLVVTYPAAIAEKVAVKKEVDKNTLRIKKGERLDLDFLNEMLFSYAFERVDFVSEPGEFSVRGGIIDVFSYADKVPYRIDLFGDEVDSIRSFDLATQLSTQTVDSVIIQPNLQRTSGAMERQSLLEFMGKDTLVIVNNPSLVEQEIRGIYEKATDAFQQLDSAIQHLPPAELYVSPSEFESEIAQHSRCIIGKAGYNFSQKPQPSFNRKFDLLIAELRSLEKAGYTTYLCCQNDKQRERFRDIFTDLDKQLHTELLVANLHEGFIDETLKIACLTDHQFFERYHKFQLNDTFTKKEALTLKELTQFQIGDFVTHIDHGVGKFAGLKKIDVQGKKQEAIKLFYQNNDILYVSIHSLYKISKFKSKDGTEPKINKLGSPAWKNLKNKTKGKVKEVAFDLIKLYAKRRTRKGFAFAPDTYLQHELEASFIYEDTPDQLSATQAVKSDMESERVMDRLICGDVGFGKTEVAIRAAFKAVTDGKQVAILVPTTVLAFQHHKTFVKRLQDFPVRIEFLNRFKSAKQKKEILEDLQNGKIDIVIGTHQLVNPTVKYKDLGLLIVDEEHKFGVNVKDKLKTLKANLDTLTLTATPIPRTLQFSLMAARDLSVIKTPPPNRQPIDTHLIGMSEEQIRDAIAYEIQREGQVYFINNRIENLKEIAGMIQRLVPEARVSTGHGQMEGKQLERTMMNFMDGKYDVLVSTTIVESGLDVSNANTIFINNANQFGLADLHQMRGRVGRSNRKAFCYLITPPLSSLSNESRKRLQAIEQFSDLGSGFNIAMKDLEIRGAGNLLGAEQSGFISDIGFDAYQKILNEAIEELKATDFKDLFRDELANKEFVSEVQIDTDLQLLIPDDYVNFVEERLALYNELAQLENATQLEAFRKGLVDRFGPAPVEVENLFESLQIKWICKDLGVEKWVLKNQKMLCYFVQNPNSDFYTSPVFRQILNQLQNNPKLGMLKEKPARNANEPPSLLFVAKGVNSLEQAEHILQQFAQSEMV